MHSPARSMVRQLSCAEVLAITPSENEIGAALMSSILQHL